MKCLKVEFWFEVPKDYVGIAENGLGTKAWFKNGQWHREDGPAVEYLNGTEKWFANDKLHRTDGPALIRGNKNRKNRYVEYWINDEKVTQEAQELFNWIFPKNE